MPTQTLKFRATARFVTDLAKEIVEGATSASVTINRPGGGSSGAIAIQAKERSEVDKAVELLRNDFVCKDHFFNE